MKASRFFGLLVVLTLLITLSQTMVRDSDTGLSAETAFTVNAYDIVGNESGQGQGVLGFGEEAQAADYYIDYETGNDSNDGLSTATPWKHCPGDIRATDNANIILSPGDTVVFKGGSVYEFTDGVNGYIEIGASGSEGNRITYISGHVYSTPWGSGRAVIDCTNAKPLTAGRNGVFSAVQKGYFTIQGFEMHSLNDTANEYHGMIGISDGNSGTANYITIDDVLLYNFTSAGIIANGRYTAGAVPTNLTIKNSTIHDSWAHLVFIRWGWTNVLIENNNLDKAGSDPHSAGGSVRANCLVLSLTPNEPQENITVRGNIMGDSISTGNKGLFMIQGESHNIIVEDNYFYGYSRIGGTHITGYGTNLIFRNNVYHVENVAYEGIIRFRCGSNPCSWDGIKIYSNTFVSRTDAGNGGASGIIYFYGTPTDPDIEYSNVDIRNNIIDTDESIAYDYLIYIDDKISDSTSVVDLSTFTCDYNAYQMLRGGAGEDDGAKFYATNAADPTMTFTQWKTYLSDNSVSGADAHSIWGQVTFADESNDDFRLAPTDLIALDKGTDLSSEGFSDDKAGVTRPQYSAWDIGAYEYIETGPDTTPPTRSNGQPTGELPAGTTNTAISLTTNESATCRYSTTPNTAYASMANTFSTTGTTSHSTTVSGLENGGSYTYYVRCEDAASNANPDDYPITFSVAGPLVLHGAPADETIHLSWTVNTTLPVTSTWQITYDGPTGDQPSPISGIVSPTRAYTLTGLTNYTWYTVTLNAMMSDSTPFLTDTVRVMPSDIFVYLPIVLKGPR